MRENEYNYLTPKTYPVRRRSKMKNSGMEDLCKGTDSEHCIYLNLDCCQTTRRSMLTEQTVGVIHLEKVKLMI